VTRCFPSSATHIDLCHSGKRQRTFPCLTSSTRVPAFGSEMARIPPFGLIAVTSLAGGRGISPLQIRTAYATAMNGNARIDLDAHSVMRCRFGCQILDTLRVQFLMHALKRTHYLLYDWIHVLPSWRDRETKDPIVCGKPN